MSVAKKTVAVAGTVAAVTFGGAEVASAAPTPIPVTTQVPDLSSISLDNLHVATGSVLARSLERLASEVTTSASEHMGSDMCVAPGPGHMSYNNFCSAM